MFKAVMMPSSLQVQAMCLECGICYMCRYEGAAPEVTCNNPLCSRFFHHACLFEVREVRGGGRGGRWRERWDMEGEVGGHGGRGGIWRERWVDMEGEVGGHGGRGGIWRERWVDMEGEVCVGGET